MSIHSEDENIIQKGNTQSSVIIIKPGENLKHIRTSGIWPFLKQK